jgi:hypothetical protein
VCGVKPPDLPPIPFEPVAFIPRGEAKELPPDKGWALWDFATEELDRVLSEQQEEQQQ